ncbi:MAG TPA: hypothetical protein VGK73_38490, partial [Polyangiaceae bacterium]
MALADDADGIRNVRTRRMRDLRTDGLTTPAATLADPGLCHDHFSTARWTEFAGDVREFRRATKARRHWENMQRDHGYNPPPVWTLIGRSLASLAPPTPAFLGFLASLDLALIAAALALLGWAFGARIALTAAIFWATQAPSDFGWTGGGFLRQDWLFCVIAALALLRKRRPALAGAALATAALLRLFPALLFVGPLAVALGTLLLRPRASFQFEGRFFAGAAAALLLLGAASVYGVGGSAYPAFWEHIQLRHTSAITNHMSLRTLFAFAPDARIVDLVEPGRFDPGAAWVEARAQRLEEVGGLYRLASAALVLATLLVGLRLRTSWAGLAVSVPLIAALTDP